MIVKKPDPILMVFFYKTDTGSEPVRDWLKGLPPEERKIIGEDIKTVQFGWPIGMPLVEPLGKGLWQTRSNLKDKIARVIFVSSKNKMILLHGFIKKDKKTPKKDLDLAKERQKGGGGV
jgi:phage-related protein